MARAIWKGNLGFGLLQAPVALYPATQQDEIDFDWLKKDTLQPVGYKRVVKETGEEVGKDDVVRGVKQDDGTYVVLSDEEIQAANVKATHSINLLAFVPAKDLAFVYFETPYLLGPSEGGEKPYALLREALLQSERVGIAEVVMHHKQHLAALIATPDALYLNTLRWATEIKQPDGIHLPATSTVKPKELEMAVQLIKSMSAEWDPSTFKDTFRDDIMALVKKKAEEGRGTTVSTELPEAPKEEAEEGDLIELLKRSLRGTPGAVASRQAHVRARSVRTTH